MKIAGIYLAAGKSTRMGKNKLALPVGGGTVGGMALQAALKSTLNRIYIIMKEEDDGQWLPDDILSNKRCIIVKNPSAHLGHSYSIRCGIQQAQIDHVDAALVLLADQPFVTTKMIEIIINQLEREPANKFVAASFQQKIRPPVLFSASMFPALLRLTGDGGAKAILHGECLRHGRVMAFSDKRLFMDIDTEADYKKLLFLWPVPPSH